MSDPVGIDPVGIVHARAREEGLLAPGRPVVVMVSGGRDSTCLLEVAVALAGREAVSAVHANYGLREGAAGDEAQCVAHCERLAVPLAVHRPRSGPTGNLQAWAREERYGAARALAAERAADLAAAHTADDQVETILYRLASSPSRRALLGMRPHDGRLIRPLLHTTRAETTAYCRARGVVWRDDPGNEGERFARGRVRTGLVPALRAIHPGAEANVLALAETLRAEADVLDEAVDAVLGEARALPLERLRELPPALARLVVQRMADAAVGRPAPGAARRAQEVLAMSATAALDLPHGVRAVTLGGELRMVARP